MSFFVNQYDDDDNDAYAGISTYDDYQVAEMDKEIDVSNSLLNDSYVDLRSESNMSFLDDDNHHLETCS